MDFLDSLRNHVKQVDQASTKSIIGNSKRIEGTQSAYGPNC